MPPPSADQLVPFQRAMRFAARPPALVKSPPATSAGPLPSSWTASASTEADAFIPLPSADQAFPSHCAMQLAGTPPALANAPPATSLAPPVAVKTASARTSEVPEPIPLPRADQRTPFQRAT